MASMSHVNTTYVSVIAIYPRVTTLNALQCYRAHDITFRKGRIVCWVASPRPGPEYPSEANSY